MAEVRRDEYPHKELTGQIIGAAIKVQRALGPGLLESSYQACLAYELRKTGHKVLTEVGLDITYEDLVIENAYRMDLMVDDLVVVELKTVEKLLDLHFAQLHSYLRFSRMELGLLINFWAWPLKDKGIHRVVFSRA